MSISKIEMQDTNGNALYPHTTGDLVNYDIAKTVNQKIDEAMTNLASLKAGLATAVNNKTGSSLTSDSTLADITSKINQIVTLSSGTADANATAANILAGSTAYIKGNKITGTMTNQGAKTSSLNCDGSYTIPAGYHNGSGKVTANSLASQTTATATAGQILSGQTAYVNGNKITGSMPNMPFQTNAISVGANGTNKYFRIPKGAYLNVDSNGVSEIVASATQIDENIVPSNIISGKTICGVNGTATVQSLGGIIGKSGVGVSNYDGSISGISVQHVNVGFQPDIIIVYADVIPKQEAIYARNKFGVRIESDSRLYGGNLEPDESGFNINVKYMDLTTGMTFKWFCVKYDW